MLPVVSFISKNIYPKVQALGFGFDDLAMHQPDDAFQLIRIKLFESGEVGYQCVDDAFLRESLHISRVQPGNHLFKAGKGKDVFGVGGSIPVGFLLAVLCRFFFTVLFREAVGFRSLAFAFIPSGCFFPYRHEGLAFAVFFQHPQQDICKVYHRVEVAMVSVELVRTYAMD